MAVLWSQNFRRWSMPRRRNPVGVDRAICLLPRVAPAAPWQPWAEGHNAVGVENDDISTLNPFETRNTATRQRLWPLDRTYLQG